MVTLSCLGAGRGGGAKEKRGGAQLYHHHHHHHLPPCLSLHGRAGASLRLRDQGSRRPLGPPTALPSVDHSKQHVMVLCLEEALPL